MRLLSSLGNIILQKVRLGATLAKVLTHRMRCNALFCQIETFRFFVLALQRKVCMLTTLWSCVKMQVWCAYYFVLQRTVVKKCLVDALQRVWRVNSRTAFSPLQDSMQGPALPYSPPIFPIHAKGIRLILCDLISRGVISCHLEQEDSKLRNIAQGSLSLHVDAGRHQTWHGQQLFCVILCHYFAQEKKRTKNDCNAVKATTATGVRLSSIARCDRSDLDPIRVSQKWGHLRTRPQKKKLLHPE